MKNTRLLTALFSILCFSCFMNVSKAQTTGSFNANIDFMGQPRTLALYVPVNYDPAVSYGLMVCLHGAGDNSNAYRNALINSLAFQTAFPGTIFICPDGGNDQAHDFYTPASDQDIIDSAIAYARNIYNIDTSHIVLQGFSLGGRSALRYGLDHPSRFKGLILNTPALQGVKDALNQGPSTYNYANAALLPVYMTHGATDMLYTSPVDSVMEQLVLNNAPVRFTDVAGIGHTIPQVSQMPGFTTWMDSQAVATPDLDLVKIIAPLRICNASFQPSVLIRNLSSIPATAVSLQYSIGGNTQTYNWQGNLAAFGHEVISLPAISTTAGSQDLHVNITGINGATFDTDPSNNEKTVSLLYESQGLGLPFSEDFESNVFPSQNWVRIAAGDLYTIWDWDNTVSQTGAASMFSFNSPLLFDTRGRKDEMETPMLNLQPADPVLSFGVAYNYLRYTPPFLADTTDFADTLEVLISIDCGNTFQSLYRKGGADLATFPEPILNATNVNAGLAVPAAANWRTEHIDLSAYSGNPAAIIKFSYVSGLGGSINIDNINVKSPLGLSEVSTGGFHLYPNPAADNINIVTGSEIIKQVVVIDASGKIMICGVNGQTDRNRVSVDTRSLSDGVYFCRVETNAGTSMVKFLISK